MSKLNEILKNHGIRQFEIANILSIKSMSTINLKINGKANFSMAEAKLIKQYINQKTNKEYSIEDLFE